MSHRIAIATLVAVGLIAARADASTPCYELLGNNHYRCQVRTAPDAVPSERCLSAHGREGMDSRFGIGRMLCSCMPRGKVTNLAWDASAEVVCSGVYRVTLPGGELSVRTEMLSGLVTRAAIKRGFAMNEQGLVEAVECVLDPTCAPTPE